MLVNITGGNKHLRSLAHSLVEYCAEHLFSKNLKSKIILDIEFSKKLYKIYQYNDESRSQRSNE